MLLLFFSLVQQSRASGPSEQEALEWAVAASYSLDRCSSEHLLWQSQQRRHIGGSLTVGSIL